MAAGRQYRLAFVAAAELLFPASNVAERSLVEGFDAPYVDEYEWTAVDVVAVVNDAHLESDVIVAVSDTDGEPLFVFDTE